MSQPPTTPILTHEPVRVVPSMAQKTFRSAAAGAGATNVWEFDLGARVTDPNQFISTLAFPANSSTTNAGGAGPQVSPQIAIGAFLDVFAFTSGAGGGTVLIEEAADASPCLYRTVDTVPVAAGVEGGVQGYRVTGRFVRITFTNVTAGSTVEVGYYLRSVEGGNPASGSGSVVVGPVVPGTGASNLGKAEGQSFAPGDVGVESLGVVDDGTVPVPVSGKYTPTRLDPTLGAPKVLLYGVDGLNGPTLRLPFDAQDVEGNGTGAMTVRNGIGQALDVNVINFPLQVAFVESALSRADTYVAAGNGVAQVIVGFIKYFTLQVIALGPVTSWDVRLEGTLDGANWGQLAAITNVDGSGTIKIPTQGIVALLSIRTRCAAIVLGGGTNVTANILGMG